MDSSASGLIGFAHGQNHSGILTDVLLFSDINLLLIHHDRVHKRGFPHIAFRKDYLTRLRVLMSQAVARSWGEMLSPVPSGPVSTRLVRSAELESESPRRTRLARRWMRPVRVPPLLPVSLRQTVVSASLAAPPREDCIAVGDVSPKRIAIPELGVAPLVDSDTDLKDELPTPEHSMFLVISPIWSWRRHCSACLFCLSW